MNTAARLKLVLTLAAFALLVVLPAFARADEGTRLRATLTAVDGSDASGRAEFRDQGDDGLRLEIDVQAIDSTDTVVVLINGAFFDTIDLDENGSGRLRLESRNGDSVPDISSGDDIQIVDATDGTPILEGTFGATR
jgi:hypothetical protein